MIESYLPSAPRVAVVGFAAGASFFTLMSWDGLADDASAFLVPLFWICIGVAVLGLVVRALPLPRWAVPVVQTAVLALALHRAWAPQAPLGGWLPTPDSLRTVEEVLARAVDASMAYAAPITRSADGFPPLMIAIGAAVVLLVDVTACTARRVLLAGLPLLAAFTVPVSLVDGVPWATFALAALCFVLMVAADQAARLGSWGGAVARDTDGAVVDNQPRQVSLAVLLPKAARIGLVGIGLAVAAPMVLPATSGLMDLASGPGSGDGSGDGDIRIDNPMVDLRGDLIRAADVPQVYVRTENEAVPTYLRLAVLDEFDGTTWRPADRSIPATNRAAGALPEPPGLDPNAPRSENPWTVQVDPDFRTTWLPVPYPASSVEVAGDWRYDEDTLDLVSYDDSVDAAGLTYDVTAVEPRPDAQSLVSAPLPPRGVTVDNTRLPGTVPPWLEELAVDVTSGAASQFERAVLLQRWFREDGGFEYSLDAPDGSGLDQLARFLGTGPGSRVGYCEQFSSAMAMMARTLRIPARVSVGFLRPTREQETWVFSSHDLHAWPELYFEGAGWVRFEPTPPSRAAAVPGYTAGRVPTPPGLDNPSAEPSLLAPRPTQGPVNGPAAESSNERGGGTAWFWIGGGLLVIPVLLAVPRALRAQARRRRLGRTDPNDAVEGAWAEVRATAIDLGVGWDDGATLRVRAVALHDSMRSVSHSAGASAPDQELDPRDALESLVLTLERVRYSRDGLPEPSPDPQDSDVQIGPRAWAEAVTGALWRSVDDRTRRRARWLPVSLWRARGIVVGRGSLDRGETVNAERVSL